MTAITRALSAALLHFVWQGLAVTILFWLALFLLRKRPASQRYAAGCVALALLVALPAITTWALYERPAAAAIHAAVAGTVRIPAGPPAGGHPDWLALAQAWAVPVWSCGVLLFSLRMAWGCTQIAALRRAGEAADARLRSAFAELAGRMGVTQPVRLLLSTVTDSPSVTGWLRPVILLPISAAAGLTPEQLEAVLAHELAHIRRHDYLVNLLQTAAETLLFYHPAVWWISARVRHERELCCDDLAVRTCGGALSYARALTSLERMRVPRPALALGSTDGPLFYRIQRLVLGGGEYGPSKLSGTVALTLGLVCAALFANWARGQEPVKALLAVAVKDGESDSVMVDTGGAMLLHRAEIEYPEDLQKKGIQGTVSVEATVDAAGQVIDARVLSGANELRKPALASVLNWHFAPGSGTSRIVQITFHPQASQAKREIGERKQAERKGWAVTTRGSDGELRTVELAGPRAPVERDRQARLTAEFLKTELAHERSRLEELQKAPGADARQIDEQRGHVRELMQKIELAQQASALTSDSEKELVMLEKQLRDEKQASKEPRSEERMRDLRNLMAEANVLPQKRLAAIDIYGLSEEARKDLAARLPLHSGDMLTTENIEAARQVVTQFDAHLGFSFGREPEGVVLRIRPEGGAALRRE